MTRRGTSNSEASIVEPLSYEEFLTQDWGEAHVEWVNGEAVAMAPVSYEHQAVRQFLLVIMSHFIEHKNLGVLCDDPFQMKTAPDLPGRAPDLAFVASRRRARLKKNYLEGPADLVVEIISEGSRGVDRGQKFYEYEQGGVKEYWLIDPIRRQTEFYVRARDGHFRPSILHDDVFYRSTVLRGFQLDVRWLWKRPPYASVLKQLKLI